MINNLFVFFGKVQKGQNRGKDLGFPTANIKLHKKIPEGVYASQVKVNGGNYAAATFIGSSKTFNEKDYKSESYILDFNEEIYGKFITVKLLKKLRGNIKFSSKEELVEQIKKDVLNVRSFFSDLKYCK